MQGQTSSATKALALFLPGLTTTSFSTYYGKILKNITAAAPDGILTYLPEADIKMAVGSGLEAEFSRLAHSNNSMKIVSFHAKTFRIIHHI